MNKPKTVHGIDLTAAGGIEGLIDFHRKTFGNATMTAGPGENEPDPKDPPKPTPPPSDEDKLGEPGLKALQAERDARAAAERDRDAALAKIQKAEDEKLSDIDKANKAAATAAADNVKLEQENLRLTAIAEHSVPKAWQHLVSGTDAASLAKSAEDVAKLVAQAEGKKAAPEPVGESGTGGGTGGAGSSLAAGRERYEARKAKK